MESEEKVKDSMRITPWSVFSDILWISEVNFMSEDTTLASKPKQLLTKTLKMVRGENTLQLVEDFTAEMTLVAEGLCEDQAKVHTELAKLAHDADHDNMELRNELELMEKTIEEHQSEVDRRLADMKIRLEAVEKQTKVKEHKIGKWHVSGSFMQQLSYIVTVAAGSWVIVSILRLFR